MKTLQHWFDEYGESHQNKSNKTIHYVCVPAIFFSIVGLLMSIPSTFLTNVLHFEQPILENWAFITLLFVLLFYFRLSIVMGIKMTLFSGICLVLNYYLEKMTTLWLSSTIIFVVAWIGQFYGHKVEGKKPSFLKDIQFLLIGPAWVIENLFSKK